MYLHVAHQLLGGFVAGDENNLERFPIPHNILTIRE